MNILSAQEMNQAQINLLKTTLKPSFRLRLPAESEYSKMPNFQSQMFPTASPKAQQKAQKIVKLTDNLKQIKSSTANGVYQSIFYSIMRILYQDKYRSNNQNEQQNVHYLLETLKCSLYSPDIDFSLIKGVDCVVETTQMKAMAATFLNIMETQELKMSINRLKCLEWICEHNPILVTTFVLFFRFILMRLEIQGSSNYKAPGNIEESIVNLIEYFDLAYRNFGQVFMFYEDGIFMTLTEEQIVIGDYYENQNEKNNEKQQLEIKSSVKLNMIESFLMNVDQKSSLIAPKNKNCFVDSDLKLLNLMLDDDAESEFNDKQKQRQLDTPHFNQGSQDFHFGKKRKQSEMKHEDIRLQLKKLISDKSDSFIESEHNSQDQAPTPFLGGQQNYTLAARFAQNNVPQIISQQMVVESPSDQLQSTNQNIQSNNFVSRPDVRKTAENLNLYNDVSSQNQFSPQSQGSPTFHEFEALSTQTKAFCKHDEYNNAVPSLAELQKCLCRSFRVKRNTLSSNTVCINFIPSVKLNNYSNKMPLSNNVEKQGKRGSNQINSPSDHKFKLDHKPAFLKNLRKKGQNDSHREYFNSTVGSPNRTIDFPKRPRLQEKDKLLQKTSAILTHEKTLNSSKSSKSLQRDYDTFSSKSQNKVPYKPRFQTKGSMTQTGVMAQKTSGFHQKVPQYSQLNKNSNNFISHQNSPSNGSQPYKFYAPVQIIAPTVYLNSSKNNSNNVVLNVNDYKERKVSINEYGTLPNPENRSKVRNDGKTYQSPLQMMKNYPGVHSCSTIRNNKNY